MNYRLIVIDKSLKEKSILKNYKILSKTNFESESPMYKVEIPKEDIPSVTNFLKNNLKYPYYAHLYDEDPENDNLIVIFEGQIFNTSKTTHEETINYGLAHGVSKKQMDIKPKDIKEEDW